MAEQWRKTIDYLNRNPLKTKVDKSVLDRLAASNTWRSCTRCVHLLQGYPTSACMALQNLPGNLTLENDCIEFEKRGQS